jgi:hypothetical protein
VRSQSNYFGGCEFCSLPHEPMLLRAGRQVYEVSRPLFSNSNGCAVDWMSKLQGDPNSYFPFRVDCTTGNCSVPISAGNVLELSGQYEIGSVQVTSVDATSFTFLALENHALAAGGTVSFEMVDQMYSDGHVEVGLSVRATEATSGFESNVPFLASKIATKFNWSMMAAAFQCGNTDIGKSLPALLVATRRTFDIIGVGVLLACGSAYCITLAAVVRVLFAMRLGAALLVGAMVLLGVLLNLGVLVLSRRDPARRNFTIPLSVTSLLGAFFNLFLMGMAVVLRGCRVCSACAIGGSWFGESAE